MNKANVKDFMAAYYCDANRQKDEDDEPLGMAHRACSVSRPSESYIPKGNACDKSPDR